MRFSLDDDQQDLRRTVRTLLERTADARAAVPAGEPDRALWDRLSGELGLAGLAVPEKHGGAGAGMVELAVVAEELGAALAAVPFLSTAVVAASALQLTGDDAAAARHLPEIAKGSVVAVVLGEPARVHGDVLSGAWPAVPDAADADLLLVPGAGPGGLSLYAVDPTAPAVRRTVPEALLDPSSPLAAVELAGAAGTRLGAAGGAAGWWDRLRALAAVGLAAEQLGGARHCLDTTTDYLRSRIAFGRPIGSFQALKHRCAGLYLEVEAARAVVYHAAWSAAAGADLDLIADATAAHTSETFRRVAGEAIQLHGGIGFTWEHEAHRYLRRAWATRQLFDTPDTRYDRIAEGLGA
ncbi:acyl-CoA dehydrogenase family protein [Pseudonocardia sp. NPDC049154]|uniref:acyl-CoA dehydrogenase family protein n=1 Tax=Pseudonocardia sp. NPDC049154 TaxID=3155501 RepID=UPI00340992A9